MTISIRLSSEDAKLIKTYASLKKQSVSEVVRLAIIEQIEDEYDIQAYKTHKAEFEKNPVTYSLDEVERELGLK